MIIGVILLFISGMSLIIIDGFALGLTATVIGIFCFISMLGLIAANAIAGTLAYFKDQAGSFSCLRRYTI